MTDHEAEARAILTRAAIVEAQRQNAAQRGDLVAAAGHSDELRRLWARYEQVEPAVA